MKRPVKSKLQTFNFLCAAVCGVGLIVGAVIGIHVAAMGLLLFFLTANLWAAES